MYTYTYVYIYHTYLNAYVYWCIYIYIHICIDVLDQRKLRCRSMQATKKRVLQITACTSPPNLTSFSGAHQKSPIFRQKRPIFCVRSPVFRQKSPMSSLRTTRKRLLQTSACIFPPNLTSFSGAHAKSPIFRQKRPIFCLTSPVYRQKSPML